jgi:tetratricopeptide (TPR) repeat protein
MKYDRLGFPIAEDFPSHPDDAARTRVPAPPTTTWNEPSSWPDAAPPGGRRRTAGRGKKLFLLGLLAAVVVPGLLAPGIMPAISEAIVQWSLERAMVHEARGEVRAAIGDVGRAIRWTGDDPGRVSRLLCWRATLRIEHRDTRAALADADRAITITPLAARPRRVRALARVILREPDGALADAEEAVELSSPGDPEALNHRAYIRALVGRDLDAALVDIDAALAGTGAGSPEFLDTKGYVLHLLGRHHEAVDELNAAIDGTQKSRRDLMLLAGRTDPDELAYRLRFLDHGLAVMHHHRGLACQAMGLERQARQDFEIAERKGYAPDRGIF